MCIINTVLLSTYTQVDNLKHYLSLDYGLQYLHISLSSTVCILTEEIVSSFQYSRHELSK